MCAGAQCTRAVQSQRPQRHHLYYSKLASPVTHFKSPAVIEAQRKEPAGESAHPAAAAHQSARGFG